MSAAFCEFMRQYKMTGSEKADGYSQDVFEGLDEHEKETVFNMLLAELTFSVRWLFFLNREKALAVVKEKEAQMRGDGYRHVYMLQEQLVKYSGDLLYQNRMIEDYPAYVDNIKPLVVDAVGRTPQNMATEAFFKQIILTEVNTSAVARAARLLLAALEIPRATAAEEENYNQLVKELRSESIDAKLKALNHIAKYEKNLS
jgi:hypothetical protein